MRRATFIILCFGLIATSIFALDFWNTRRATRIELVNADGEKTGVVLLRPETANTTLVSASIWGLSEGHHGFHIHEYGECEVTDEGIFITAGGHFDMTGQNHGEHSGDMPSLLADEKGVAYLSFRAVNFGLGDLRDNDGSAIIVHAGADNFANIPERYGGADATSLANGDAGARVACGIIR